MSYHPQPINFEPPRFCCFPIRPLLIFTSTFGIVSGAIAILRTHSYGAAQYTPTILILLDFLTLLGAYYNDEKALRWSRRVVIASIWFAIVNVAIWPILVTGLFVLAVPVNETDISISMSVNGNHNDVHPIFVTALLTGYLIELAFAFWIGKLYIQYIIIHRLWVHVKNTTVHIPEIFITNPNFVSGPYGSAEEAYIVH